MATKKKSVLQSSMDSLGKGTRAIGAQVQGLSSNVLNSIFKNLTNGINNVSNAVVTKPAFGVASMENGNMLMSNGQQQQDPNQPNLSVLRQQILDQHAFTPQAAKYLQTVPLELNSGNPPFYGLYTPSSQGDASFSPLISLNREIFDKTHQPATLPAEVLTHEFIHALDSNVNNPLPASVPAGGANSGNSTDAYSQIKKHNPAFFQQELSSFLSRYGQPNQSIDPNTKNVESFAQTGSRLGNKVLLQPPSGDFNNIFQPVDKVPINYSPIYPISNFLDTIQSSDQRGGYGN